MSDLKFNIKALDAVDSTNDEVRHLAQQGATEGLAVWAKTQTAGRGRYGREWISPEGNLYASFLLRPGCALADAQQLSFVAALAVKEALEEEGKLNIMLKWPNDILANGKKLGGILLESASAGMQADWVVVGVGINIIHYPPYVHYPATSLAHEGVTGVVPEELIDKIARHLAAKYAQWQERGFAPMRQAWLDAAVFQKENIKIRLENKELSGIFEGLTEEGALILVQEDGSKETVTAGDVFPCEMVG